MTYSRRSLSENEKLGLKKRQDNHCFVCTSSLLPDESIEYDHIKSLAQCEKEGVSENESNDLRNFAAVHKRCNRIKSTDNLNDIREVKNNIDTAMLPNWENEKIKLINIL